MGYTDKTPYFKVGGGGYMKRPPVFLRNGGSCLSTIVLTISLNKQVFFYEAAGFKCFRLVIKCVDNFSYVGWDYRGGYALIYPHCRSTFGNCRLGSRNTREYQLA